MTFKILYLTKLKNTSSFFKILSVLWYTLDPTFFPCARNIVKFLFLRFCISENHLNFFQTMSGQLKITNWFCNLGFSDWVFECQSANEIHVLQQFISFLRGNALANTPRNRCRLCVNHQKFVNDLRWSHFLNFCSDYRRPSWTKSRFE